jgi:hypothetical protein
MRNQKIFFPKLILLLLTIGMVSFGFIEGDKRGSTQNKTYKLNNVSNTGKQGDAFRMNINNLDIPINRVGTIAAVNIPPSGTLGRYGVGTFLFSGGFLMSGYSNGNLWAFGQATASLVENMTPGTVASGSNDPDAVMYVLDREEPAFGLGWQDWKTAVDKFGADFYDGDGDGQYNPVDKNGNGEWDADEDAPDLLGDKTAWCVYTDGIPGAQRTRYQGVNPQGVEIRQTVFAFASKGALGDIMFIRYRIKNSGLVADRLDSVLFGVWADPDVGTDFENDLVGVDVPRNAGFTYNAEGTDPAYGVAQPCFMIDFFLGPRSYIPDETFTDNNGNGVYDDGIDTALDTAFAYRGKNLGISRYPGAKNLPVSSFVHYLQSDPLRGDPDDEFQARNYMNGRLKLGEVFDPCGPDAWGGVFGGVNCATLNNRFWYSGDPVTNVGWLTTTGNDQRQMTNVGPFTLNKDDEIEILVAYIVGQGTDRLTSITKARQTDDGAQFIFDGNFRAPIPPPTINVEVQSGEDFIDFLFPINRQVGFVDSTSAWIDKYHSTNVYAYRVNSTQDVVAGVENSKLYTSYQRDYFVKDLYKENAETGGIELLYTEAPNKLDYTTYTDSITGKIRLRVTSDPFTGGPLVKGKPYYFAFTSTAINYDALVNKSGAAFGTPGDYYLSVAGFVAEVENVPRIITVVLGEDMYDPPIPLVDGSKVSGGSNGQLQYDVVDKDMLTGDKYSISFEIDSTSTKYSTNWILKNENTGFVFPPSNAYLFGSPVINEVPTEGFLVKLSNEIADSITIRRNLSQNWATANIYYLAKDMDDDSRKLPGGGTQLEQAQNNYTKADKLRRVVLKFGQTGKAYRYLNGFVGANPPARNNSYVYAGGVTETNPNIPNPSILSEIGKLGEGYVDVPFTAWVEDEQFGETRQLAVGFLERRKTGTVDGKPDGNWDPGTNVNSSGEFIFIFNQSYDPNGGQLEYTGNFPASSVVWSDLRGYTIPADANATPDQRKIAASPFFDVLYTAAINRADTLTFWSAGDQFEIEIDKYPYTPSDKFEFQTTKAGALTEAQEKALFEKVTVYPNPLYGFNVATSYTNSAADEPFVTFSNLPEEVTIKVYSLSGQLLRTLGVEDKSSPSSPFLRWNLQNESGLRVASGMYFAIVTSPKFGEKVLKFAVIMPQKQIQKY